MSIPNFAVKAALCLLYIVGLFGVLVGITELSRIYITTGLVNTNPIIREEIVSCLAKAITGVLAIRFSLLLKLKWSL